MQFSIAQCTTTISTFPYTEGFESGTGFWTTGGTNNDWAWGTPTKPVISGAGAGSKCWIVGGLTTSFYNYGEKSWCQSPCFDFSTISKPYISFLVFWDTEYYYDGGNLQYSIDGGNTWANVGSSGEPAICNNDNWFNSPNIINLSGLSSNRSGWSGNTQPTTGSCNGGNGIGQWARASHCIPQIANQPQVIFRFTFGSGTTCNNYDGFAIDDFYIGPPPTIPADFTVSCINNNTFQFSSTTSSCSDYQRWDFGDPATQADTSLAATASYQYPAAGTYTIKLTSGGSCSNDTFTTKQVSVFVAAMSSTPVTCEGDSDGTATIAITNAPAGLTYAWNTIPVQNSPTAINLSVGSYRVTVTDPAACSLTDTISIQYGPFAFPVVDLGKDTSFCPGQSIILHAGNFSSYIWQDSSTDSLLSVYTGGKYQVFVLNQAGCETSDSLFVLEDCLHDILFPNAFTPNGDLINEVFKGMGTNPESYSLQIYNRWGELIFESDNLEVGWDGSYKNHHTEDGLYIYLARFSFGSEEVIEKSGSVYLFR